MSKRDVRLFLSDILDAISKMLSDAEDHQY